MAASVLSQTKEKMQKAVNYFQEELKSVRTGRASVGMFDGITVDYYGAPTPLSGVASISAPEPRLIVIQPWDANIIPDIEKAIVNSNMGFNPSNDGKLIRIPIPQLTEERRKEFVKLIKKMAEEAKVVVRNERRDGNDKLKKLEKDKEISEDEQKKYQDQIQELTNEFVKEIDEIAAMKEKDIMEI